jgi:myosin heavy subunit
VYKSISTNNFNFSNTSHQCRAGNTSMSPEHLASNISSILSQVPLKVPRKWANIKSISVKTTNSVALPIYNKTLEELEEIKFMADVVHTTTASNVGKGGSIEEEKEKKKKRKELAEKSPLAKALKKQKKEQKDDDGVSKEDEEKVAKSKTPKSSKKRKDKSESLESTNAKEEEEEAKSKDVKVKSAKKTKDKDNAINTKSTSNKAQVNNNDNNKTTKSIKDKQSNEEANATFIPSKKYTGSKSGYVFRKDKQGLGYYIDVKPVVDKVWLNKLQNSGKNGGGRKSMGNAVKKRRGGGRRSY